MGRLCHLSCCAMLTFNTLMHERYTPLQGWQKWQYRITQALLILTLFVMPIWWKVPQAPAPFSANYVMGFTVTWLIVITSLSALVSASWKGLRFTRWHIAWSLLWIGFLLWTWASQSWAFVREDYPAIAQNATLITAIMALFAISMSLHPPPTRAILATLMLMLVFYGVIGALQVMQQGSLGLPAEFTLNPAVSGANVIQAGDMRWLRPHGLLPHPNIWAGFIGAGLFASAYAYLRGWRWALLLVGFGWWLLLMSFSRGAWLGFGVATLMSLPFLWRMFGWRRLILIVSLLVILGVVFVLMYAPLLNARTGAGQENTEMRSIADRIVYTQIALDAIQTAPLQGIGAGNYPWYASDYLYYRTDYDLRGDNVHTVILAIASELGIVGTLLWLALISMAMVRGAWLLWHTSDTNSGSMVWWAIAVMWLLVGIFDHYPWTLSFTQSFWVLMIAWSWNDNAKGNTYNDVSP
jgi:O-antigen ligase